MAVDNDRDEAILEGGICGCAVGTNSVSLKGASTPSTRKVFSKPETQLMKYVMKQNVGKSPLLSSADCHSCDIIVHMYIVVEPLAVGSFEKFGD